MLKLIIASTILAFQSLAISAPLRKNHISCVARVNEQGILTASAFAFSSEIFHLNEEMFMGAYYAPKLRTGYCQSMTLLNNNEIEYKTVRVLRAESDISFNTPCNFSATNIYLEINKKVTSINDGYFYSFKAGDHEFGSGDILRIDFLTDLNFATDEERELLNDECLRSVNLKQ